MENDNQYDRRKKRKRLTRRRSSKSRDEQPTDDQSSDDGNDDGNDDAHRRTETRHKKTGREEAGEVIVDQNGDQGKVERTDSIKDDAKTGGVSTDTELVSEERGIPTIEISLAPDPEPESEADETQTAVKVVTAGEGGVEEEVVEEGDNEGFEEERIEEMTDEERKAMYEAVKLGEIDLLEELMDIEYSDINMIWFSENLLMTAIRTERNDMIEFLIDNGVNVNYQTSRLHVVENQGKERMEWFKISCRQMAYDRDLQNIVNLIDHLNGNLFKCVQLPPRILRLWRPKEERLSRHNSVTSLNEQDDGAEADAESSGSEMSSARADYVDGSDEKSSGTVKSTGTVTSETRDSPKLEKPKTLPGDRKISFGKNPEKHSGCEPWPPLTAISCPTETTSRVHTSSRRVRSACRFSDTKSNMFRRKANRREPVTDQTPTNKNKPEIFERRSWRMEPGFCPCSTNSYVEPKTPITVEKRAFLVRSAPAGRHVHWAQEIDSDKSGRHKTGPILRKPRISVDLIDTKQIYPFLFPQPRRAWEPSQMNKVLTSLPQIGRAATRVNSTLYTMSPMKKLFL